MKRLHWRLRASLLRLVLVLSVLASPGVVAPPVHGQADDSQGGTGAATGAGPSDSSASKSFSHVVVIVQENRSPDNLFQGLCDTNTCNTSPTAPECVVGDTPTCYDIQTSDWLNKDSPTGVTQPGPVELAGKYDLGHSHTDWEKMCDLEQGPPEPGTQPIIGSRGTCKMDGAGLVKCGPEPKDCLPDPQFRYVDNTDGILNPYLQLATRYGWANYMFQTNQGPSFPAHQFLFGGTSAPSAEDDKKAVFSSENMHNTGIGGVGATAGCIAARDTSVQLIQPPGTEKEFVYPCFDHDTVPDVLPSEPLVVVSAYTPEKIIDNERHDFGSILRYIEQNFGLNPGVLTFADARSRTDLHEFFDMSMSPARKFQEITSSRNENFFLTDSRPATNPDVD